MLKTNILKNVDFKKVVDKLNVKNSTQTVYGETSYLVRIDNESFLSNSSSFFKVALETNFCSEKEFVFLDKKYRLETTSIMYSLLKNVLDYAKLNLPEVVVLSGTEYKVSYSIFKRNSSYYSAEDYSLFNITISELPSLLKNSGSVADFNRNCLSVFYNALSVNYENIVSILNDCLSGNIYFIKKTFEYFENEISFYKIENKLNFSKGLSNQYTLNSSISETAYTNLKVKDIHRKLVNSYFHDYFNDEIVNGRSIDRNYKYELYKSSLLTSLDDYSMFSDKLFFETEEIFNDENSEYEVDCFFIKGKISSERFDLISKKLVSGKFLHGLMQFMSGLKRI